MLYVGVALQVIGLLLILIGGFRAALQLGALGDWWTGGKRWAGDGFWSVRKFVVTVILRRREPVVVKTGAATMTADAVVAATMHSPLPPRQGRSA